MQKTISDDPHAKGQQVNRVVGYTGHVPGAAAEIGRNWNAVENTVGSAMRSQRRPPPPPQYPTQDDVPNLRYVQKPMYDRLGRTSNTTTFILE
jgi:hypothetical protein